MTYLLTHVPVMVWSLCVITGVPPQLSVATTALWSAAGTALADEIRAFVGERLAWYQAPREIVFVDELPLTATGKIIRRELRGR